MFQLNFRKMQVTTGASKNIETHVNCALIKFWVKLLKPLIISLFIIKIIHHIIMLNIDILSDL